jgi:uncharacterized protein DUF1761
MLEFEGLNYWAVAVAWLVNLVVGAYWYSPAGFARQWTKHTGIDIMKMPGNESTKTLIWVALSGLVQAAVLAVVVNSLDVTTAVNGLLVGVVLWFGLTAATTVGVTLYSQKSWKFLWLNSSYFLLVMVINSIILAIWQ